MAVAAHPDDESSATGGVLARYASEGVRTVVVTCTNGELGDGPQGVKPGEPGHDDAAVAALRLTELAEACRILGVSDLETLGYRDSGMADWQFRDHADAFCNVPLDTSVARLVELIEKYRPDVIICDDDQGGYNHPDHLRAHALTVAAFDQSGVAAKLYHPAFGRRTFEILQDAFTQLGVALPFEDELDDDALKQLDGVDERITTRVDTSSLVDQKRTALAAHASQIAESWFAQLPHEVFAAAFGVESFIRARSTVDAPVPEDDLFAGLRGDR
jgi:LmbE family N-acetylglucosaminyl deacetylase